MDVVERAFRDAHGPAVASLIRIFGDLTLAEDAVQDAFVTAVTRWRADGVPENPAGWIVTTARNRAVDVIRRSRRGRELAEQVAAEQLRTEQMSVPQDPALVRDDQLRLIFMCCHPAIRAEHQVALTLRLVAGLTPAEVASAFLVSEETMSKRLVRAKYKIKAARVPYRVPDEDEMPDRMRAVLSVIYLIYNAGADDVGGGEVRAEAIRLTRVLVDLMPDDPEAVGLLALIVLTEARMQGRYEGGDLRLLKDQDRSHWDRSRIAEGQHLVLHCLRVRRLGPYQLQAAIQALHCAAPRYQDTDWATIVRFYDRLAAVMPTPVVALNRAIAVAETQGAAAGLALLTDIAEELDGYHVLHAARGSLLIRLDRRQEAAAAYERAAALARGAAEVAYLHRRASELAVQLQASGQESVARSTVEGL